MISALILAAGLLWTHAPGWTDPFEVIETPNNNPQVKDLVVTSVDHLHQAWSKYGGESRVGYNLILPDGTILVPDQMISNDVQAAYPRMARLGEDSVVIVWQESYQFWLQVRNHDGQVITSTTAIPIPPASWIWFSVACDSLNRIHLTSAHLESPGVGFVLYSVHAIDGTVLFTDSIPDSYYWPEMCIDGSRVHIKYDTRDPWRTMYIQYDLDGNIVVNPVLLFDDDLSTGHYTSLATDSAGDVYIFLRRNPDDGLPEYASLYKLDSESGAILIDDLIIYQGPFYYSIANDLPAIESMPGGFSFYLAFMREHGNTTLQVEFCIIDTNGDFIEDPYVAYDYTDEPIQQLEGLASSVNYDGDLFLTWCEGDTLVGGYYIVLGWLDYDWVGIQDDPILPDQSGISLSLSSNPFTDFLSVEVTGVLQVPGLSIYDIYGRQVIELYPCGENEFIWDGRDRRGEQAPIGTYFIHAESQNLSIAIKVVKLD
jgi:hypothetical protein